MIIFFKKFFLNRMLSTKHSTYTTAGEKEGEKIQGSIGLSLDGSTASFFMIEAF